jgi:hypothetical protein
LFRILEGDTVAKTYTVDEMLLELEQKRLQSEPKKGGRPRREQKVIEITDRLPESKPKKQPQTKEHPMGRLMQVKAASMHLNELFDGGYSVSKIRQWIKNGTWQHKREYRKTDGRYKIDIDAVKRWQATQ